MNTKEKNQILKNKERTFSKKKNEDDKNSIDYFKIKKEVEKELREQKEKEKESQNSTKSEKYVPYNLTEKIYAKNSEKLGDYYNSNKKDLLLYGSKKYDLLTIQKLVKEMSKYRSKILQKINENKKSKKARNYNFESCDEKAILTPLAQSEKNNKNLTDSIEKKKYEEAQRSGVVMRRIEYVHLLEDRDSFKKVDKNEDDKKIFLLIKDAVDKIERNWLLHKWRKQKKEQKENNKDSFINTNNNIEMQPEQNIFELRSNNYSDNIDKIDINKNSNISDNNNDNIKNDNNNNNENNNNDNIKNDNNNKINRNDEINNLLMNNKDNNISNDYNDNVDNKENINNNIDKNSNEIKETKIWEKEQFYIQLLSSKKKININKFKNNIKVINKSTNRCFIRKLLDISSSKDKKIEKKKLEELQSELIESKNNYLKIKTLLDKANLENKKLQNQIKEEISNNKKEKEKLIQNNKEINEQFDKLKKENEKFKKKNHLLNDNYNKILNDNNQNKNELNEAMKNNKLLMDKITILNTSINTKDTENEKKTNDLQTVIDIITNEKKQKNEELEKNKFDIEEKNNKINSYENEINNLKSQILEKDKINEINIANNNKNIEEYKKNIALLEKENKELQNSNQILEELSKSDKDKYNKLNIQKQNDIQQFNNEKKELKKEISNLKQELNRVKKEKEKEKNNELNALDIKDKYEKKLSNQNKVIEELKIRILNLYLQLSFLQNSHKFNKTADIVVRLKLMILLIRNYLDKNIIFDKREFFNILLKKLRNRYYSREKKFEYLRENIPNGFPF